MSLPTSFMDLAWITLWVIYHPGRQVYDNCYCLQTFWSQIVGLQKTDDHDLGKRHPEFVGSVVVALVL